jgi:hypothetical protein
VDTIALNLPQIRRVGILVDGQPRETLAGHVAIGRPFAPDYRYVEPSARPGGADREPQVDSDAPREDKAPGEGSEGEGTTGGDKDSGGGAGEDKGSNPGTAQETPTTPSVDSGQGPS